MSVEALNWAFKAPLMGKNKAALVRLADIAGVDGVCQFVRDSQVCAYGQAKLARQSGMGVSTWRSAIRELEELGYLETQHNEGRVNHHQLNVGFFHEPVDNCPLSPSDPARTWRGSETDPAINERGTPPESGANPASNRRHSKTTPFINPSSVGSKGNTDTGSPVDNSGADDDSQIEKTTDPPALNPHYAEKIVKLVGERLGIDPEMLKKPSDLETFAIWQGQGIQRVDLEPILSRMTRAGREISPNDPIAYIARGVTDPVVAVDEDGLTAAERKKRHADRSAARQCAESVGAAARSAGERQKLQSDPATLQAHAQAKKELEEMGFVPRASA